MFQPSCFDEAFKLNSEFQILEAVDLSSKANDDEDGVVGALVAFFGEDGYYSLLDVSDVPKVLPIAARPPLTVESAQ